MVVVAVARHLAALHEGMQLTRHPCMQVYRSRCKARMARAVERQVTHSTGGMATAHRARAVEPASALLEVWVYRQGGLIRLQRRQVLIRCLIRLTRRRALQDDQLNQAWVLTRLVMVIGQVSSMVSKGVQRISSLVCMRLQMLQLWLLLRKL